MKLRKKHVWIIALGLILLPLIVISVRSIFPYYSKSIPSILGIENIESECIDKGSTWTVSYEVYKLSDVSVKEFLEKTNKELSNLEGYKRVNWRKGSLDSLSYGEYLQALDSRDYRRSLNYRERQDSISFRYYHGSLSYKEYMDSLSYRNEIPTWSSIEEISFSSFGKNRKIKKNIDAIHRLFCEDAYYSVHYKNQFMFILYILDEKNNLLYITSYWI